MVMVFFRPYHADGDGLFGESGRVGNRHLTAEGVATQRRPPFFMPSLLLSHPLAFSPFSPFPPFPFSLSSLGFASAQEAGKVLGSARSQHGPRALLDFCVKAKPFSLFLLLFDSSVLFDFWLGTFCFRPFLLLLWR